MWPRWFVSAIGATVLLATVQNLYRPMVSYRALELGATNPGIGYLLAAYGVASLLVAAPGGQWVDRLGETPFVVGGSLVMAGGLAALARVDTLLGVGILQALIGASHVIVLLSLQTYIANRCGILDRDARFGVFALATSVGQVAGPILAGSIATATSTRATFVWASATTLLIVGAAQLMQRSDAASAVGPARAGGGFSVARMVEVVRIPSMPQAMVASLTVLAAIDLITAYLPVYGETRGIGVGTVGLLLGVRGAAGGLSRVLMMPMLQRWTRKSLLVASLVVPGAAVGLIPLLGTVPLLAVALSVAGFGLGLGQPMSLAWVTSVAPPETRGTAIGLRLTGNRAGQTVIPAIVGLVSSTGIGAVFAATAALLVAGGAVVHRADLAEPAEHDTGPG
jgi:MFS family permease